MVFESKIEKYYNKSLYPNYYISTLWVYTFYGKSVVWRYEECTSTTLFTVSSAI